MGLRFFLALEPPDMTSQWSADEYISFVLRLIFGFGLVFEMPVMALFLSKVGILTAETMRRIRRYAIVVIFVLAAIITPPDPVSQLMMALPLLLLYELSIWICKVTAKEGKTLKNNLEKRNPYERTIGVFRNSNDASLRSIGDRCLKRPSQTDVSPHVTRINRRSPFDDALQSRLCNKHPATRYL